MNCIFWTTLRCQDSGRCGEVTKYLSAGSPYMYFGTIQALDRVESVTSFCSALHDSSTAMSAALLPMPTTRIRLPVRSSGVRRVDVVVRVDRLAGELARELGDPRVPVVAVGDHEQVEVPGRAGLGR